MIASPSRSGGCGCGQPAPRAQDCGCGGHGPRDLPGGCRCAGPERVAVPCVERPVFSAGQLLTADALRLGQRYLESRFALRRHVDGVGVVSGLHVRCDPGHPGWIVVEPGYAVACTGDDLVLCEPVRMDLRAALAPCRPPGDPCGGGPLDEERPDPATAEPLDLGPVGPGEGSTQNRMARLTGRVLDAFGGPVAGATVAVEGTAFATRADVDGSYVLEVQASGNGITAAVRAEGGDLRPARRTATFAPARVTQADFHLEEMEAPEAEGPRLATYVLRAEPAWEGREPVPVVTQRAACDARTECRPSRERATLRLCLEPLGEDTADLRSRERTRDFRRLFLPLFERMEVAVSNADGGDARILRVIDVLLRSIEEEPPRTVCNLAEALCELRRVRRGQGSATWLPPAVVANPEAFLAGVASALVDDRREEFLLSPADDCCEHAGVRLAHVVVDESAGGGRCAIAAIDTHSPGREVLHPRGAEWRADRVALYDAYFRGAAEAGVLLTSRGLRVYERPAAESPYSAALPEGVQSWLSEALPDELRRLGVYARSDLYARFGTTATLWTVAGRVVAIDASDGGWEGQYRIKGVAERLFRPLAGRVRATPVPAPAADKDADGGTHGTAAVDPAPFSEVLNGVGARVEAQLLRAGVRTFAALADTPFEAARAAVGRTPLTAERWESVRAQAREIARGNHAFTADDLRRWSEDARRREESARPGGKA